MAFLSSIPLNTPTIQYLIPGPLSSLLLCILVRVFTTPLRTDPGPFITRFSRLWKLREYYNGSFEKTNINLHRKYGQMFCEQESLLYQCSNTPESIVRVAPNEYSIDDPDALKIIYGHGGQFQKAGNQAYPAA